MLLLILAAILTILILVFIISTRKINQTLVVEIMISSAWSKLFAKQNLEDKRDVFLLKNKKYSSLSEKKIKKKVAGWEKQITSYDLEAQKYMSGKKFSMIDAIVILGYNLLLSIKPDANSEFIRKMTRRCEFSGYLVLERGQETNGRKNSVMYAYFLMASFLGYFFIGVILAIFLSFLMIWMEKETMNVLIFALVGFALPLIIGYLPMEELRVRTEKRQEEIDRDFPNILSKTALLVTAGMNITKALEEACASGTSTIYVEFQRVMKEVGQSSSVAASLASLQSRCSNRYLDRMVSLITKSYSFGNANLADDLREINRQCWNEKKHQARRLGELVQTKLFIPTMLMFVGILVVIIVPAMAGFNF